MKTKLICVLGMMTLLPSVSVFAEEAPSQQPIPSFAKVTDGIYEGGRPTEAGMEYLASIGVKTDIDLQGGDVKNPIIGVFIPWFEPGEDPKNIEQERSWATALQMNFLNAPLNSLDEVTAHEADLIDHTLDVMNDPSMQPVFIHCEHGKDRTGMLVALYRVKYQHWTPDQAYQEWVDHGHGLLNSIVTHDLDSYFFRKAQELSSGPDAN